MTQLAVQSLVDIQSHVQLLINNLKQDPRKTVKLVTLRNMNCLARKSPHLWKFQSVEVTFCYIVEEDEFCHAKTSY